MEYLVTMTTHVPDGTSQQDVQAVRTREAGRSPELQANLASLPMDAWTTVRTIPLTPHPSDPAINTG